MRITISKLALERLLANTKTDSEDRIVIDTGIDRITVIGPKDNEKGFVSTLVLTEVS